jgi:hypothetical protein
MQLKQDWKAQIKFSLTNDDKYYIRRFVMDKAFNDHCMFMREYVQKSPKDLVGLFIYI